MTQSTATRDGGIRAALTNLRERMLGRCARPWCPGTGMQVRTGATTDGRGWCPYGHETETEAGPAARYRLIGEHPA